MYHLVYTSYATEPFSEEALINLLKKCRENNKKLDITGMLLYVSGKFIQVLEGNQEKVKSLYREIEQDDLHKRVTLVMEGESEKRIFSNWSMGFKGLSNDDFSTLSGFQDTGAFFARQKLTEKSSLVLVFLQLFYKKNMVDYPEPVI